MTSRKKNSLLPPFGIPPNPRTRRNIAIWNNPFSADEQRKLYGYVARLRNEILDPKTRGAHRHDILQQITGVLDALRYVQPKKMYSHVASIWREVVGKTDAARGRTAILKPHSNPGSSLLPQGTRIYYTGDRANEPDFGVIKSVRRDPKWGDSYDILLDDGREFKGVFPASFHPSPGQRFMTEVEYKTRRQAAIESMRRGRPGSHRNPSRAAQSFISRKIPKLIHEGYPQKQAVAIAYSMARKAGYRVPARANCCNNPKCRCRTKCVCSNPLLQTVMLANPGKWTLAKQVRALSSLRSFEDLTVQRIARRIGLSDAEVSSVVPMMKAGGVIRETSPGRYTLTEYGKRIARSGRLSNPPISQVWDTLTHRRRHAALEFAGFPDDYARTLARDPWRSLALGAKRALERAWAANPLTRKESALILRSARRDVKDARFSRRGFYRGFSAGRASGQAEVVQKHGPKGAFVVASMVRGRAGKQMPRVNPSSVRIPFREGQRIPIARARAWVERYGTPELKKAFRDAERLQTRANKRPQFVTWKTLPIGDSRQIEMVTALAHYGDTPDTYYKPPKGSRKGRHLYKHSWGETGGKRSVPLLATPSGKALVMPLDGRKVAGDWLRH